jgi:hypothetical protein
MRYRRRLSQAGLNPLILCFSWSPGGPSDAPELWVVSERCTVKLPQAASLQPSKLLYHHNPTCSKEKNTSEVLSYALRDTATSQLIRCPKSVTGPLVRCSKASSGTSSNVQQYWCYLRGRHTYLTSRYSTPTDVHIPRPGKTTRRPRKHYRVFCGQFVVIRPSSGLQKCHLDSVRWLKSSPYEVCPFPTLANPGCLMVLAASSSYSAAITATAAPIVLTEPSLAS